MWQRSELKTRAKEVFKRNYWKAVLAALILNFVMGGGGNTAGSSSQTYLNGGADSGQSGIFHGSTAEQMAALVTFISVFFVIFLVIFLVGLAVSIFVFQPLEVGGQRFFIKNRREEASLNEVTFAFSHSYLNIVKTMFLRSLYIFLWSLLFIIPGIIKAYEYMMMPYILAENPEMETKEVFARSKEMMAGEKWRAFVLDLSFIGWKILGILTCCVLSVFFVSPYYYSTLAELYAVLKQKTDGTAAGAGMYAAEGSLFQ